MNHIYRLVFNRTLGCTQAAPETARAHGKGDSGKAAKVCAGGAALVLLCAASPVLAADTFIDTTGNTVIGTGGGTHGSPWNVGGWLFVGDYATGDLTISNGGQVSNGLSSIGNGYGSNGTVTVTGSGSTWTNGTLRVGYYGIGTLIIENGGQVSSQEGRLGVEATSSAGTVTVTGAGSQWTTNGSVLRVGQYGTGTLVIANGGTVLSGAGFIGERTSSHGAVTVTGGGNWTSSEVAISYGGVLNIGNHDRTDTAGTVTTNRIFIGTSFGFVNFNQTDNISFATPIEGNITVNQRGSGKTTFTTSQTYNGGTNIDSGTLALSGSGSIASSNGLTLTNTPGATFDISGITAASTTIKTLNGGGAAGGNIVLGSKTLVVDVIGNGYYDGVISGAGGLTKSNAGMLRITGNHTYTGGTSILGGTLLVGAGGTTGSIIGDVTNNAALVFNRSDALTFSGVVSGSGTLGKQGAGTLTLTGNSTYSGGTTISGGTLRIGNGGATGSISGNISNNAALVFNRSNAVTFADVISGSGTLEKQSTGVLSLTGANTYTGLTSINGGTLMLSGDGSIAASSGVTLADTASAYLDIAFTTSGTSIKALNGGGSSGGNVLLGSKTLTIDGGGTYAGEISGAGGSLTKTGAGTLTLTGSNIYNGGTTISGGTLQIGNGGTSGSISGNVINNAALIFSRSNALTFAGDISGSGTLEKQGAGTLTLTGDNTHSGGTTISNGTLQIGNGGASGSISGDVTNNAALIFSRSNAQTFAGDISGSGTLEKQGADTLMLTGDNTYSGGTTISSGTLRIGDGGTAGAIVGDVANSGALIFDRSDALNFGGEISGSGSVTQAGAGMLTLTGVNTYTGTTTVAGGKLAVNGAIAASAVTVQSGGTLGGSGTVGATTVQSGGHLAPGNSVGTLNVAGDLTLAAGSHLDFELGSPGTSASPAAGISDRIVVSGDLDFNGTVNLAQSGDVADGTAALGYYRLITYGGALLANTATIGATPGLGGAVYELQAGANRVDLFVGSIGDNSLQHWQGGDGTWNTSGTQWLNQGGTAPAAWAGTHAVFKDAGGFTGGTITIDGVQSVQGIQFVDAGYRLEGAGTLMTDPAGSELRVLADSATIATAIAGTGGIVKTQAGTLILTGANTYSGGTTISGGTLQIGNGGTSGAIVGDVANNGALVFNRSDATSFAGVVSGNGSLEKQGAGMLTLTGDNTHSGGTTISNGTLKVGDGGATGSLAGDIANNAALIFDRSDATSFAGVVSGSGSLEKQGAGTLTLTGNNTHSGGTTISNGTLKVGNGGTTGSVAGDIANNAALIFDRSDATSFAGVVSGNGTLEKQGAGMLTLISANTYTGLTTISNGRLSLSGSGSIAASSGVTLANRANTLLDIASTSTGATIKALNGGGTNGGDVNLGTRRLTINGGGIYAGGIYGAGNLTKTSADTLTLTGNNTYTGGTTISNGTLKIGDGGTTGSIAGDITNSGALIFDRSDALNFAGTISGSGSLEKQGAGMLTLTGDNTHSGGTTISNGTLQIGNGGTAGAIGGDVANNAALIFNRSDALTFAGNISGTGTLEKQGTGMLTLTGNNTYSGATTVSGGTLLVNGSSANSAVAIGSGGTLGGSGTVGKVTVNSGGTLAPGNSPGLLTVNGDLILNAGSTTRMEINGTARGTDYDAIDVTGNAALDGTLDLAFGYVPTNGTSFKLIDATGGISGNFASVTSSNLGAGLLATSVIDPTTFNILISLAQQSYVGVSGPLTANQRAVAINLDTFSTSGQAADLIAALNTLSAGDLPPAFDALSGVEHSFVAPLAFGAARQLHGLLGARGASLGARGAAQRAAFAGAQLAHAGSLSGLFDGERNDGVQDGFWLRALASDGRIDRDRNASGADLSGGGLALGADRRLNADWLAGLAFAYGASKADAQHGTINLDSYQLATYARWQGAQYYVDGSLAFGRHRADSVRKMAFLNQRAKAKYDADSASFALEAGRPSERGQAVLTPFVGLEGQILRREGFTESGAGGANLKVKGRTDDSLRTIVGARYAWQGTRFAPSVEAAWVHAFGDEKARIDARFAAVPTASAFTVLGPKQERDRLRLGLGLTAWTGKNARLDIAYQGEFARSDREHAATATLRWVW